jgi:CBS domain-containing protein
MPEMLEGRSVTDVMLSAPKTVPPGATVAEVRELLTRPSVQMLLIADGDRFCGALTTLPDDADDDAPALAFADTQPESLAPSATAEEAFARTAAHPDRRVVVLDDDRLVGLVCLDETRTRFCGRTSRS